MNKIQSYFRTCFSHTTLSAESSDRGCGTGSKVFSNWRHMNKSRKALRNPLPSIQFPCIAWLTPVYISSSNTRLQNSKLLCDPSPFDLWKSLHQKNLVIYSLAHYFVFWLLYVWKLKCTFTYYVDSWPSFWICPLIITVGQQNRQQFITVGPCLSS